MKIALLAALTLLAMGGAAAACAGTPNAADRAFVDKVSQGGMFEVAAGKLAETLGSTQDIRDFAAMEVHDHALVGHKLNTLSSQDGLTFPDEADDAFRGKLDHLKTLSGPAFDQAYMDEMGALHAADGAAFAKEALDGGSAAFKAFGAETYVIVQRHIGAIHAAPPSGT